MGQIDVIVTGLNPSALPCVFKTIVLKSNEDIFTQVNQPNIKYVIKWNYDLGGETLNVPAGCIFVFDGGQLSNGHIQWNVTKVLNQFRYETLKNITESGDKIEL